MLKYMLLHQIINNLKNMVVDKHNLYYYNLCKMFGSFLSCCSLRFVCLCSHLHVFTILVFQFSFNAYQMEFYLISSDPERDSMFNVVGSFFFVCISYDSVGHTLRTWPHSNKYDSLNINAWQLFEP